MPKSSTASRILEYLISCDLYDDPSLIADGFEMIHFHRLIEQLSEEKLASKGINLRLVEILECLFHHPDGVMTPAELSDAISLSRSAMTSALDSLEKLGYTCRNAHLVDRRMVEISLTENGRAFTEELLPERYDKFIRIMSIMTKDERALLLRTHKKVYQLLKDDLNK